MCYLMRQQLGAAERDPAAAPSDPARLRPRRAIAAGAMLIGGLAVAAALVSPPETPTVSAKPESAAATFAATGPQSTAALPGTRGADRTSVPVDDEVPTAFDSRKAGMGGCSHDL